ncbi:MAG: hypothetical protein GXO79_11430 [Chlorobi bacterium]|nr:hypothetical protein [Chlorobiota bacterium]
MVLENWKKQKYTKKGINLFYDKDSSKTIIITNMKTLYNMPLEYEFQLVDGLEYSELKYFKTKKQALTFARAYMRTH